MGARDRGERVTVSDELSRPAGTKLCGPAGGGAGSLRWGTRTDGYRGRRVLDQERHRQ